MNLTPEEVAYFNDPENWAYGPTYDLTVAFGTQVSPKDIQDFLISDGGFINWKHPRKDLLITEKTMPLLLLKEPSLVSWPIGFLHLFRDLPYHNDPGFTEETWPGHRHYFVLYTPQFVHLCGDYPHFYDKTLSTRQV